MAIHSAQAAAISQPISPAASASRPLLVHLSLAQLSGPVDPPKPDVFDELDHARFLITVQIKGEPIPSDEEWRAKAAPGGGVGSSEEATALADKTATLFPGLSLAQLRPSSSAQGEALPDWLKQASGKVTSLAAARMPLGAVTGEQNAGANEAHSRNRRRPVLRVAVGCEDGSLWLFTSPDLSDLPDLSPDHLPSVPNSPDIHTFPCTHDIPRTSLSTLEAALHPHSPSRPLSPSTSSTPPTPPHLNTRSRRPSTSGKSARPHLSSRRSSVTSVSLRRVSSSNSISTLATFEVSSTQRPRKASATVCVSTGTPNSSSDIPFVQSLPPPALVLSSPPTGKRGHRAKDSITTGIGLWEQDSVLSLPATNHSPQVEEVREREEVEEQLRKLEPLLRIRIGGRGEVVGTAAVEGMRCAKAEGGKALLVLRRDGMLSLHSWVDGKAFGSCDAASTILPADRTDAVSFDGLAVLDLAEGSVAICYGRKGAGLVIVDLDTLHVHETVASGTDIVRPATLVKQGVPYLVYAVPTGSTQASHLLVRPIIPHHPASLQVDPPLHANAFRPLLIESPHDAGVLDEMRNGVLGIHNCEEDLVAFDESGVLLFTIRDQRVATLGYLAIRGGVVDVCVEGYSNVLVTTRFKLRSYRLDPAGDNEGGVFNFILTGTSRLAATDHVHRLPLTPSSTRPATFLVVRSLPEGSRVLESISTLSVPAMLLSGGKVALPMQCQSLYKSSGPATCRTRVTCVVNLDRLRVLLGYSSGAICVVRYADLEKPPPSATIRLAGAITVLKILELGGRQLVVAGSVDGSAAAWQLDDWELIGQWSLFASPVSHIVYLQIPNNARLSNTAAFISANSPVALVSLFPPQLLFVLPGTKSAVESISTAGDEVLVVYTHGLSRVCDINGQELRRSMDYKTALGVLADGSWKTWFLLSNNRTLSNTPSTPYDPLFSVDLRRELDERSQVLPWAEARRSKNESSASRSNGDITSGEGDSCDLVSDTVNSREHLGLVRRLLSQVITYGLDRDTDTMLEEHLQVSRPYAHAPLALDSAAALSIPVDSSSTHPWTLSPDATAQRLLQIVCLLRVFLNFPDTERYASQVIVFYASMLADVVGPSFVAPSLDFLADFWLDKSSEVQQAARVLFGTYLAASSDSEIEALVERWQDFLPARQASGLEIPGSEQAVLIIGLVASDKFKLLSTSTLKDLSTSISTYLDDDEHPYHQAIAAELCARGFEIWQNYLDAMVLVRQLFGLATGRNSSTPNELRNLARLAALHVAGINTPLFMTTLSFDILNAQTAAHRSATMKLLGFMVRKKPLVLYSSLPRLAEAVVKSLDPTVTALRETVLQAATVILGELVRTYPSIDFHGKSQRLAVGTHEGAAIVYDLKTATRLYVLEGHKRAITALSWSPDGRRLVSVSLEESKAVVWKVGVGLFSMFTPGAPPRQGSGGTATPFKTLDFNVGDEGLMTTAATLEWVGFEWPGERTTRLRIRETALTFSV